MKPGEWGRHAGVKRRLAGHEEGQGGEGLLSVVCAKLIFSLGLITPK